MLLWAPYALIKLLRAQRSRAAHSHGARAEAPIRAEIDAGNQDAPAWSELDDRQLTRLLTDSAP